MALINLTTAKNFYTRKQDEAIVKLRNEGKTVSEISEAVGHSEASVMYRVTRVLGKVNKFEDIKYRGAAKVAPAAAVAAAPKA